MQLIAFLHADLGHNNDFKERTRKIMEPNTSLVTVSKVIPVAFLWSFNELQGPLGIS